MLDPDTTDEDEKLDEASQGLNATSDEDTGTTDEIDAIGRAAGLVVRDDRPFRGIAEVERRDVHRWELDPSSSDDAPPPDEDTDADVELAPDLARPRSRTR